MTVTKAKRNTVQRRVILEVLRQSEGHPTAAELYRTVRRQVPRISLGTVYRNLDVMVQAGQVRRLGTGGKEARFDAMMEEHYHIRCTSCGRLDDLAQSPKVDLGELIIEQDGWEIVEHRVEFLGTCPSCLAVGAVGKKSIPQNYRLGR